MMTPVHHHQPLCCCQLPPAICSQSPSPCDALLGRDLNVSGTGFTVSFSGEIPLLGGNGIPFRNFGEFRRISVDFGRNLLNFEFENEIYRKIPKFRIPVTSGNGKFSEISAKFRRNC